MTKLSTRNRLPGTVVEVEKGAVMAKVTLRVGDDHLVSLIARESVEEMDLKENQQVVALIKATDVMLMTRYTEA